jgi:hypothetical protein
VTLDPTSFWGAQPPRLSFDAPPRRTLLPPRRENAKPGHATGTGIKIRKAGRQERAEGPNFKRQTPGVHTSMVEEYSFITREYDSSDLKENGTIPFSARFFDRINKNQKLQARIQSVYTE